MSDFVVFIKVHLIIGRIARLLDLTLFISREIVLKVVIGDIGTLRRLEMNHIGGIRIAGLQGHQVLQSQIFKGPSKKGGKVNM